jgi:hypothetical protein
MVMILEVVFMREIEFNADVLMIYMYMLFIMIIIWRSVA